MEVIVQDRPRLYFTAAEWPERARLFETNEKLARARAQLLEGAESALKTPLLDEEYARSGKEPNGSYPGVGGNASGIITPCSFAYLLTGDPRFAERARQALLHFAAFKTWIDPGYAQRRPVWHSALETATFTEAFAVGIDWLGDALDEEARRTACQALARLGVGPLVDDWLSAERRIHALDSMGHNWWMACIAAAGQGALSLLGMDERAPEWLERVVRGIDEFFTYPGNVLQNKMRNFDSQGGFYESLNYANYTLVCYVRLLAALRHMFPDGFAGERFDQFPPQLEGTAEFMHHFLYPYCPDGEEHLFRTVDFGDDNNRGAFAPSVAAFLAGATGNGHYQWYLNQYCADLSGPIDMLLYDPEVTPVAPDEWPCSRVLTDIGWASLRDSWEENSTLLAIKCGDGWNHTHLDAGSFVVFAGGEPLLIDSARCSYSRAEYTGYYCQAQAHNTVLLDGKGPAAEDIYRGSKFPGRLYPLLEGGTARYLLADATGPFANQYRRFLRHFLWLDQVILVVDDLLAHDPGHFEWLFHGESVPSFADGRLSIQGERARLELEVLFPHGVVAEERQGLMPNDPDLPLPYLALRTPEPSMDTKFLGLIRAGHELPDVQVEARSGAEWLGARLQQADWAWDLFCNLQADGRRMHENGNNEMDEWETDAFLLGVREGDGRQLLLVGGSYLRNQNGEVMFDCFSKCNAALTLAADGIDVVQAVLQAPPGSQVQIGSGRLPDRVLANQQPVSAATMSCNKKMVSIDVPL
jgi:oligo-alginate lyase